MKVQVKDKQGIDEAGNKHPAPGIGDGTHECELKYQFKIRSMGKPDEWVDVTTNSMNDTDAETSYNWVLAEQEKEEDKTIHLQCDDHADPDIASELVIHCLDNGSLSIEIFGFGSWLNGNPEYRIYDLDSDKRKQLLNLLMNNK